MARILLLTGEFAPFRGGIATYVRELADAATRAGHQVTVVAPDYGTDQAAADAALPFAVRRYAGDVPDMRGLPGRVRAAWAALRGQRFDVVHAADWSFFIPLRLAGLGRGGRRLLTLHGTEILYMRHPRRRRVLDLLRFWRPGWAEWIANSRYTHDLALRTFPIAPADARAIPLGVSASWIAGRVPRDEARRRLGTGEELVVMSLGRVVPRKGHLDLADALARLDPALLARVRWWIVGPLIDPAHADAIRARTAASRVAVELFGALPEAEVKLRLSAADLFCLPGYCDEGGQVEGFGLVFLEAAAYGVPAIATRSGGIPEAIAENETGLLVPERDVPALAAALTRLLGDDALRSRLAAAALARAERATWDAVMADTYWEPRA